MNSAILMISLLIITLASGCEKRFPDYRNKYVGDYTMTIDASLYSAADNFDTVYTYEGRVWYDRKDDKDKIHIDYDLNKDEIFTLEKNGDLFISSSHAGRFLKSSETFRFTYETYSPGHHYTQIITGKKK